MCVGFLFVGVGLVKPRRDDGQIRPSVRLIKSPIDPVAKGLAKGSGVLELGQQRVAAKVLADGVLAVTLTHFKAWRSCRVLAYGTADARTVTGPSTPSMPIPAVLLAVNAYPVFWVEVFELEGGHHRGHACWRAKECRGPLRECLR